LTNTLRVAPAALGPVRDVLDAPLRVVETDLADGVSPGGPDPFGGADEAPLREAVIRGDEHRDSPTGPLLDDGEHPRFPGRTGAQGRAHHRLHDRRFRS